MTMLTPTPHHIEVDDIVCLTVSPWSTGKVIEMWAGKFLQEIRVETSDGSVVTATDFVRIIQKVG